MAAKTPQLLDMHERLGRAPHRPPGGGGGGDGGGRETRRGHHGGGSFSSQHGHRSVSVAAVAAAVHIAHGADGADAAPVPAPAPGPGAPSTASTAVPRIVGMDGAVAEGRGGAKQPQRQRPSVEGSENGAEAKGAAAAAAAAAEERRAGATGHQKPQDGSHTAR